MEGGTVGTTTKNVKGSIVPVARMIHKFLLIPGDNPRTSSTIPLRGALSESIKEDGVFQVIVIMEIPKGEAKKFLEHAFPKLPIPLVEKYREMPEPTHFIVAGERWWRSVMMNDDIAEIPAMEMPYERRFNSMAASLLSRVRSVEMRVTFIAMLANSKLSQKKWARIVREHHHARRAISARELRCRCPDFYCPVHGLADRNRKG